MRKIYDNDEIRKLARIIDVLARKCWRGLPALMGDEPKPTREQMKQAFFFRPSPEVDIGIRVQGGRLSDGAEVEREDTMIDEVDSVLATFQWDELVRTVRRYAEEYPRNWAIYKRYIINQEQTKSGWGRDGALARTAAQFDTTDYIIRETARSVPYEIARAVSMGYCRDEVKLKTDEGEF